jgi:membrane protease YdiL (CAAX protease family)
MTDTQPPPQPPAWGPAPPAIPRPAQYSPQFPSQFPGQYPGQFPEQSLPPAQQSFPGIGISLAWVAMYFALQIVATLVTIVAAVIFDPKLRDMITTGEADATKLQQELLDRPTLIMSGLIISGFMTIGILALHLRKNRRYELIGTFSPNKWSWGKTILTAIGLQVGTGVVGALYTKYVLNGKETQADTSNMIKSIDSPSGYLLGFVAVAIVAPLVEELLFRGYLQSALSRRFGPKKQWIAILVASLIFAAIHFQPLAFPLLAALGAGFGYLYHRTGSLKVNVALHMLNNGLAFLALIGGIKTGS